MNTVFIIGTYMYFRRAEGVALKFKLGLFLLSFALAGSPLSAETDAFDAISLPYTQDLNALRASLTLPVSDSVEKIAIPLRKLKLRAFNPKNDLTIEPLSLNIPRTESGMNDLIHRIASKGKAKDLSELILERMTKQGPSNKASVKIDLEPKDFELINLKAIGQDMAKEHHRVTVHTRELSQDKNSWNELRQQLSFMLPKEQLVKIARKVKVGLDLSLDEDLLPSFAKKMVGKFIIYRGPNCFHAALAFFDQQMTRLPTINVKEEEGYHKSMINYDELWRVINNQFYEIDPRTAPMKFGDMLVFFAVPPESSKLINFKTIRHTAIYLFGPYTFSKGSKSPNTPYTVKTLEEEWSTWRAFTQNLGVKVYRRQVIGPEIALPSTRNDWIY